MVNKQDRDDDFQTNQTDDTNPTADMKQDEKLPQDFDTPFTPPDDVDDRIDDTAQPTDTNMDSHELYDAGVEAASGVDMPKNDLYADDENTAVEPK